MKEQVRTQRAWYLKRKQLNEGNFTTRQPYKIPDKHPLLYMKNKVYIVINADESNLNAGEASRYIWKGRGTATNRQASNLKGTSVQVTVASCPAARDNYVLPVDILDLKMFGYNEQDTSMIYYRQVYEHAHIEFPPSFCNLIVLIDHSRVPGSASRNHLDLDKLNHRAVTKAKDPPFFAPVWYIDVEHPDYIKNDPATHHYYYQELMYGSEPALDEHDDDVGLPKTLISLLAERKGISEEEALKKWPNKPASIEELKRYPDVEEANQLWCFKMGEEFGRKVVRTMKGCPAASFIEYAWRGHKSYVRRHNDSKTVSRVTQLTLDYFRNQYARIDLMKTVNHCRKVLEVVKKNGFTATKAMTSHVVISRSKALLAELLEVPEDELSEDDGDEEAADEAAEADFGSDRD